MKGKDEKLERLAEVMLEKYRGWRNVAEKLNAQNAEGIAPTREDVDAYFKSDDAYINAKREWETRLKELYQS